MIGQAIFLMETRWVQPRPLKARTEKISAVGRVNVVETAVDGERMDFYLDPRTHLPLRIVGISTGTGGKYIIDLGDYAEVSGIWMARQVSVEGNGDRVTHWIDVDYDRAIFDHQPTIENSPRPWQSNENVSHE